MGDFKLVLWWFLLLGSLYLAYKTGGIGTAIALIVYCIEPYICPDAQKGTSENFASYEGIEWMKGDSRNPLYLQGYFRKKCYDGEKILRLAGIKGIFWHQVYTIIQVSVFVLYGIYCLVIDGKHHRVIEIIFVFWLLLSQVSIGIIADYYKKIIKESLPEKRQDKKKWCPFTYEDYGKQFKTTPKEYPYLYRESSDLEPLFEGTGLRRDEEFAVRKKIGNHGWMRMYAEYDTNNLIKMYALVSVPELNENNVDELNETFQRILETFILGDDIMKIWQLIFLINVKKETEIFHNILSNSIFQREGLYRLPVGISEERKCVYIPTQSDSFGIYRYEMMKKEVLKLLE